MHGAYYGYALLFMLTLDGIWLSITSPIYKKDTMRVQKMPMNPNYAAAALAYGFMYVGLVCLALPNIVANTDKNTSAGELFVQCLRYGGVLGAVIYGVYNCTNKALLTNYSWSVGAMDTVWGTVMMTLACFFTVLATRASVAKQ